MRAGLVFKSKRVQPYSFLWTLMLCVFALLSFPAQAQLDDPTRPPGHRLVLPGGKKAAAETRFLLSSIRISATRRIAVVNDRFVELGDTVNGAQVIAISPSAVKLKKKGKIFSVKLLSQVVKKTRIP